MVGGNSTLDGYAGNLNRHCVTIAEALKPAGYRTYMVGKWHVARSVRPNGPKDTWPLQRGFDKFYGTLDGAGSYYDPVSLCRGNTFITPENDREYRPVRGNSTTWTPTVPRCMTWLRNNRPRSRNSQPSGKLGPSEPMSSRGSRSRPTVSQPWLPTCGKRFHTRADPRWLPKRTSGAVRFRLEVSCGIKLWSDLIEPPWKTRGVCIHELHIAVGVCHRTQLHPTAQIHRGPDVEDRRRFWYRSLLSAADFCMARVDFVATEADTYSV